MGLRLAVSEVPAYGDLAYEDSMLEAREKSAERAANVSLFCSALQLSSQPLVQLSRSSVRGHYLPRVRGPHIHSQPPNQTLIYQLTE